MVITNAGGYYPSYYAPSPFTVTSHNYNQRPTSNLPYSNSLYQPQQKTEHRPINQPNQSHNSSFKLYDLDTNNQGEIIRLIFAFVDVPYKDKCLKQDQWNKIKDKMPFDQLPILRLNSQFKLSNIYAIIRYLAHEFRLYGTNKYEHAIVDVVLETTRQFREKLFEQTTNSTNQEQTLRQFITDQSPIYFKKLEKLYDTFHHHGAFYLGSQISLADLIIYDTINYLIKTDAKLLDNYTRLKEARRRIGKHPRILNYINTKNINRINTRFYKSPQSQRHRTKSPTPVVSFHQNRHRSHDEYKSKHHHHHHHHRHHHRRHSKEPTPLSQQMQSSKSPSILTMDNESTLLRTTVIIPPPPPVITKQKSIAN